MPSLRWLHLTDLHCGMREGRRLWPTVKEAFFEDLRRLHGRSGPWDLVLFTGDLTQRGSAEDFTELDDELDELWDELATMGSRPALVAVPGNHDLARPDAKRAAVRQLRAWNDDPELRDEFWADPKHESRAVVAEAFKHYVDFTDRFVARHPWPEGYTVTRGVLPGDVSVSIERAGLKVALVGLNSAFLQLDGGDYLGKLDLDARQLTGVCGKNPPRWLKQHHLALLLTHHPTSWLHRRALDEFRGNLAPAGRFFAHLYGHMHEARAATTIIAGADALREAQGSSLLGLETWGDGTKQRVHGYAAAGVDVTQDRGDYHQWPRAMVRHQSGAYQMVLDTSFKLTDERLTERFVARVLDAPAAPPASAPPAAVAPGAGALLTLRGDRFEALVRALMAAFTTPQSLARLARFKLDVSLATLATGNLSDQCFALVEWTEANGRTRDLIVGARQENPGNPTLAAFAASVGVEAPTAPVPTSGYAASASASMGQVSAPTSPARELREALSRLYGTPGDALRLAADAGVSRGRVDFSGPMQNVWFNLLEEATKSGSVAAIVRAAQQDYPQDPTLARLAQQLAATPQRPVAVWTSATLFDALTRLLPAQFEVMVFSLAVPTHYMPGTAAPLAERAVALVRIFEQQGRLGELGAALDRLGVRPTVG